MDKSVLKSKTLWVSLIVALAPIFPSVQNMIKSSPESAGAIVGIVFAVLRAITHKPLVLVEDKSLLPKSE